MVDNFKMMALSENLDEQFDKLVQNCMSSSAIDLGLYQEYDVKRGLRDSTGKGVLTGLTEISDVTGYKVVEGVKEPADGRLYYQGYDVNSLTGATIEKRFAFEETTYLLLFGELPTDSQLKVFIDVLSSLEELSGTFVRDVIMKAPSPNLMNGLQKSVLALYSYDASPDDISASNVLRQSLQLIAKLPLISVYNYHAYRHFIYFDNLVIKPCVQGLSIAENILHMLRPDGVYTPLEARVLDAALVLHAEHGGGNNSTFTNHVVTSSGTDTYSAVAASIASLKGPRHGGANLKVQQMFKDLHENVNDTKDEDEIREYLKKILCHEAFDGSGLIYGIGHAVYTLSDPRANILKDYAGRLAKAKGENEMAEYNLHTTVERIAKELVMSRSHVIKPVCANVDFYSGLIYSMLGIPEELFTPLFAISRISGWSAHRLEEIVNKGKIIRPAYKYVGKHKDFKEINER